MKSPDWIPTAAWLFLAAFIAHFVALLNLPGPLPSKLTLQWFLIAIPTSIALGLIAGLIGDLLHLGQIGTLGAASMLGWLGTAAITALFQSIIDRIKGKV